MMIASYSHIKVGKYGKVTGFKAFVEETNSRKNVTFQLWKPADLINNNYELVAEYSFTVTGTGVNEVYNAENHITFNFFPHTCVKYVKLSNITCH